MKIVFRYFKFTFFLILFLGIILSYVDYQLFLFFQEPDILVNINFIMLMLILKLSSSLSLTYFYCKLQILIELKLKEISFQFRKIENEVNYFSFISQNLAFNYYTAIVRVFSELVILIFFSFLIFSADTVILSNQSILWLFLGSLIFLCYLYLSKYLRKSAAWAQNLMVEDSLPLLKVRDQIRNNNGIEFAQMLIAGYASKYKKFNTLAVFSAQIPRSVIDAIIILSMLLIVQDGINIFSLSIAGLRIYTSANAIINQIPLILHYRPYLQPLIEEGFEK